MKLNKLIEQLAKPEEGIVSPIVAGALEQAGQKPTNAMKNKKKRAGKKPARKKF